MGEAVPSNVTRFEILTYLGVAIAQLHFMLFQLPDALRRGDLPRSVTIDVIGALLTIFFVWAAARNRVNWVRWIMLVGFVAIMPWDAWYLFRLFWVNPLSAALLALIAIFQGAGLYFIFTGNARRWFNKPIAETSGPQNAN